MRRYAANHMRPGFVRHHDVRSKGAKTDGAAIAHVCRIEIAVRKLDTDGIECRLPVQLFQMAVLTELEAPALGLNCLSLIRNLVRRSPIR